MTQPLWSLTRDEIPEPVNPLELWKRYQAQSKANLREPPPLAEAERILAACGPAPLVPWRERVAARLRKVFRSGRRNDEVRP